jgi:hypothetical protein
MTFVIVVLLIFWTVKTGYVRYKVVGSLSSSIVKFKILDIASCYCGWGMSKRSGEVKARITWIKHDKDTSNYYPSTSH